MRLVVVTAGIGQVTPARLASANLLSNRTLHLCLLPLDELFHLTPCFCDVLMQQATGGFRIPLAAEFEQGAVFVFGVSVGVARKQNGQADVAVGGIVYRLD